MSQPHQIFIGIHREDDLAGEFELRVQHIDDTTICYPNASPHMLCEFKKQVVLLGARVAAGGYWYHWRS